MRAALSMQEIVARGLATFLSFTFGELEILSFMIGELGIYGLRSVNWEFVFYAW